MEDLVDEDLKKNPPKAQDEPLKKAPTAEKKALVHLAGSLPKGSFERKTLLRMARDS